MTKFYKILELVSVYGTFFGATCIRFDSKRRLYFVNRTVRRRYYVTIGIQLALCIFFGGRTLQLYFQGETGKEFLMCYVPTLLALAILGPLLSLAKDVDELAYISTEILKFGSTFQRKWIPKLNQMNCVIGLKFEILCGGVAIAVGFFLPIFSIVVVFAFRHLPVFPHNLLPHAWKSSWMILIPNLAGFHYLFCTFGAFAAQLFINGALYYAIVIPILKREFRTNLQKGEYKTLGSLRMMDNLLREYRTLECLHRRFFRLYGFSVLYVHLVKGQFVLSCNYVLISSKVQLSGFVVTFLAPVGLIALVVWTLMLQESGTFHRYATKVLESWKFMNVNKNRKKLLAKYRRRFRPLQISAGDYFKITRLTVLKFLGGIVKGTFRALLTL